MLPRSVGPSTCYINNADYIGGFTQPVLLMGSDCPGLTANIIRETPRQLQTHDVAVAGGGYVLIGLKAPCPALCDWMPWSTASVALETLRRMAGLGMKVWLGPLLHDIDEPASLAHLPAGFFRPGVQVTTGSIP